MTAKEMRREPPPPHAVSAVQHFRSVVILSHH